MPEKARYATAHWLHFPEIKTPDQLQLSGSPNSAVSWKIGPSGPVGANGYRLPSNIWCAVGLFREFAAARAAVEEQQNFLPFVAGMTESWHLLLLPIRHSGECNHLDREAPGTIFEIAPTDPGGKLAVITTAGFHFGPEFQLERVIQFRRNVDLVDQWMQNSAGCLASRPFTPHTVGDDGLTLSVWQDDESMLNASYRAGLHRSQMDGHKAVSVMDRSSFTRLRILDSRGQWNGKNPLAQE